MADLYTGKHTLLVEETKKIEQNRAAIVLPKQSETTVFGLQSVIIAYYFLNLKVREDLKNGKPINSGKYISDIQNKYVGNSEAYKKQDAYCAMFVWFILNEASMLICGKTTKLPNYKATYGNAKDTLELSRKIYKVDKTAAVGSLMFRNSTSVSSSGHFGIVVEVTKDYFRTIEGNVATYDNSEGIAYWQYPISDISNAKNGIEFIHTENEDCKSDCVKSYQFGTAPKWDFDNFCKPKEEKPKEEKIVTTNPPKDTPKEEKKTPTFEMKCFESFAELANRYRAAGMTKEADSIPHLKTFLEKLAKDTVTHIAFFADENTSEKTMWAGRINNGTPQVNKLNTWRDFDINTCKFVPIPPAAKKCEELLFKINLPADKSILQHWSALKNGFNQNAYLVAADITGTRERIKDEDLPVRNGSALWYQNVRLDPKSVGSDKNGATLKDATGIDTKTFNENAYTGFGMFRDNIGNMIYVLDLKKNQSKMLIENKLIRAVNDKIISESENGGNYLGFATGVAEGQALKEGKFKGYVPPVSENVPVIVISNATEYYTKSFDDDAYRTRELIGDTKRYLASIPTTDGHQFFTGFDSGYSKAFGGLFGLLEKIENGTIKLKNGTNTPILIIFSKARPPRPTKIDEALGAFLMIGQIATTAFGLPIPLGSIAKGLMTINELTKGKFNINQAQQLISSIGEVASFVAPDFVKGINTDIKKYQSDVDKYVKSVGTFGQEFINGYKGDAEKFLKNIGDTIKPTLGLYGLKAETFVNSFYGGLKGGGSNSNIKKLASDILGLEVAEVEKIINRYDVTKSSSLLPDLRNLLPNASLKESNNILYNIQNQLTIKSIQNALMSESGINGIKDRIDKQKTSADGIFAIPYIQDFFSAGDVGAALRNLPNAEQFAGPLVSNLPTVIGSGNDTWAALAASAFGYAPDKSKDIFKPLQLASLQQKAVQAAQQNIPFFLPDTISDEEKYCFKYEIEQYEPKANVVVCPEGWDWDKATQKCVSKKTIITNNFDLGGGNGGGKIGVDLGGKIDFTGGGNGGGNTNNGFTPINPPTETLPACIKATLSGYAVNSTYSNAINTKLGLALSGELPARKNGSLWEVWVNGKWQILNNCTVDVVIPTQNLPKCVSLVNGIYYMKLANSSATIQIQKNGNNWQTSQNGTIYEIDIENCLVKNSNNPPKKVLPACITVRNNSYFMKLNQSSIPVVNTGSNLVSNNYANSSPINSNSLLSSSNSLNSLNQLKNVAPLGTAAVGTNGIAATNQPISFAPVLGDLPAEIEVFELTSGAWITKINGKIYDVDAQKCVVIGYTEEKKPNDLPPVKIDCEPEIKIYKLKIAELESLINQEKSKNYSIESSFNTQKSNLERQLDALQNELAREKANTKTVYKDVIQYVDKPDTAKEIELKQLKEQYAEAERKLALAKSMTNDDSGLKTQIADLKENLERERKRRSELENELRNCKVEPNKLTKLPNPPVESNDPNLPCTDCEQNKMPRIVENFSRTIYGDFNKHKHVHHIHESEDEDCGCE